jgi:hypothetical protein
MKYFAAALPLAASLVAAQGDMQVMSLAPAVPAGAATHTVSTAIVLLRKQKLTIPGRCRWNEARRDRNGSRTPIHSRVDHRRRW